MANIEQQQQQQQERWGSASSKSSELPFAWCQASVFADIDQVCCVGSSHVF